MAVADVENKLGFVDKRRTQGLNTNPVTTFANFEDVLAMRTRLAAASAYYTSGQLDTMTKNDMVYALRLIDEAGSI